IFFIPHVSSIVAVSLMWKWILDGEYGIVNHLLSFLGVKGPDWLGDSRTFMPAMIVMGVWGSLGFYVILFSAALTNVDPQLYEAAEIDGAGPFTKFVKITMPAISPVTFYLLVMSVIWGLQDFARFQIMAPGGGPDNAGLTMVYYLYNAGFTNIITYGMGIAAAVSWILTFVIAGVTALNFWGSRKWVAKS
ncbi:MAG: sugar ABC transporter permease, partial [Peptococcia bacterium]